MSHLPFNFKLYAAWRVLTGHSVIVFVDGVDVAQGVGTEHALETAVRMRALSDIFRNRLQSDSGYFDKRVRAAKHEYIDSEPV